MTRTSVDSPWREPDEPEPLGEWKAAGFQADDAEIWRRWRFRIADARAWTAAGVDEGLRAAQWTTAGVGPDAVEEWRRVGVDATEAVAWHEFGYDLGQVRGFKKRGLSPSDAFTQAHHIAHGAIGGGRSVHTAFTAGGPGTASHPFQKFAESGVPAQILHSYFQRQWFDDDALEWAKSGVDAADAQTWKELGLKPSEGARLARHGASPGAVIRDWWRAGIPYDELADWIGAGLTAAEAAEQRGRGITAEQAAALRALRDEGQ